MQLQRILVSFWADAYQRISEALRVERRTHGEIVSRLVGRAVAAEQELLRQQGEYTKLVAQFEANAAELREQVRTLESALSACGEHMRRHGCPGAGTDDSIEHGGPPS